VIDKRRLGRSSLQSPPMLRSPAGNNVPRNAPQMTAGKPKAYSYVRFSTPDQAKGDSYRRQTEAAIEYAQSHDLELDTELTFMDLGVSAFYGANAKTGKLGTFLEAVKDGTVKPGSYLLVENLDRLTRDAVLEAQELFSGIIRRGITLVTLFDQRAYSTESVNANPMDLVYSILTMVRGHEESATKSRRMLAAYERKRLDAANGTERNPFTRMLPAWLRWNKASQQHEADRDRAEILRDIFAKADAGWGRHRIAKALNEARVDTWGAGKRKGARIQKLLTNDAVIGTFTPHKSIKNATGRKRLPQQPIERYFPAVIDGDVFARVSAQAKARGARGRHADAAPKSVFAGLLRCVRCDGSVVRVAKGDYAYLVCSKAHARAGCDYRAVRCDYAESAFTRFAGVLVQEAPRGHDTAEIETEIEKRTNEVWVLVDQAEELADIAATEKSEVARRRLREREAQLEKAEEHLRHLRASRDTFASAGVLRRLEAIEHALTQKRLDVSDANRALKQAVSKIVMDTERGTLTVHWHHAEQPSDPIYFASRHKRWENDPPSPPE
jgi:DNA invertase Pin-like site-specific DNA recombinase/F0F1-type ATP synthase epsilon subunit